MTLRFGEDGGDRAPVRGAPPSRVDALFEAVGRAVAALPASPTRWLSTAGLGVSWLHVRLDTRPKYFRTEAFRSPA